MRARIWAGRLESACIVCAQSSKHHEHHRSMTRPEASGASLYSAVHHESQHAAHSRESQPRVPPCVATRRSCLASRRSRLAFEHGRARSPQQAMQERARPRGYPAEAHVAPEVRQVRHMATGHRAAPQRAWQASVRARLRQRWAVDAALGESRVASSARLARVNARGGEPGIGTHISRRSFFQ